MAETSVQVNENSTAGARLKVYSSTDGEAHTVMSEAVTLTSGAGDELVGQQVMAASLPVVIASDQPAIAVDGPLTDAELRATAVPVDVGTIDLPTGAATDATLGTGLAAVFGRLGDGSTHVAVDNFPATQPVSAVALPLPTGAATETTLETLATQTTLALVKAKTDNLDVALSTLGTQTTLAAIKAKTDNLPAVGQAAMAGSTPVVIASNQTAVPVSITPERATTGDPVGVTVSTSAVQVLASNSGAKSRIISNNGTSNIFIGKSNSVTASGSAMGIKLAPGGVYSDGGFDLYTGDIYGIGDATSASQNVSAWERT